MSVHEDFPLDHLVESLIIEFGIPVSIISDCDPNFTSKYWKAFRSTLGVRLL